MDVRVLKEKAQQLFRQGKFAKAAEVWAQVCAADPKDNGTRLRLGDALAKAAQPDAAFEAYRKAMDGFARQGFLPQAIAAAKLALALRPQDFEVQQEMATLHAERMGRPSQGLLPVADALPPPFASGPSGLLGVNVVRSRPSSMAPGPPPFLSSPSLARAPGPPPDLSAPGLARPAPPVSAPSSAQLSAPAVSAPSSAQLPASTGPPPAGPASTARLVAAPVHVLPEEEEPPAPDLTPPLATSGDRVPSPWRPPAGPIPLLELPPADATLPLLPVRGARAVRGTDLDPDPTPPPPRSELDSTLVPGRSRPSAIRPVDLSLAGDPDSTLFIANPFAAAGPRAPSARAPEPPAAEVAGPEFGSFPHIPLFETLPPAAFLELVRESTLAVLVAGQVIVEQDALGDSFFVICGGRVRVYREEPTGRRELAILEAGAFFGELAVLTGARRSAWVVAEVDDTRLLEITGETLDRVSRHHPSVAEGLLAFARRRILSNVMASEPLFSALKRSERQAWAERFVPRELQAGELLLAPGQSPPGLVVVVAGQLLASGPPGPDLEVRPGALLGDVELLSGSVEVRVEARAPSSVLVLPPGDAAALLEHPANTARRAALLEAGRRRSAG